MKARGNPVARLIGAVLAIAFACQAQGAVVNLSNSTWDANVDLTAEGTVDWVVWDTTAQNKNTEWTDPLSDARVEKAGGTAIGALGTLTSDNPYTQLAKNASGTEMFLSWSDGTPTASGSTNQGSGPEEAAAATAVSVTDSPST
jgi:hypothetical protein